MIEQWNFKTKTVIFDRIVKKGKLEYCGHYKIFNYKKHKRKSKIFALPIFFLMHKYKKPKKSR